MRLIFNIFKCMITDFCFLHSKFMLFYYSYAEKKKTPKMLNADVQNAPSKWGYIMYFVPILSHALPFIITHMLTTLFLANHFLKKSFSMHLNHDFVYPMPTCRVPHKVVGPIVCGSRLPVILNHKFTRL